MEARCVGALPTTLGSLVTSATPVWRRATVTGNASRRSDGGPATCMRHVPPATLPFSSVHTVRCWCAVHHSRRMLGASCLSACRAGRSLRLAARPGLGAHAAEGCVWGRAAAARPGLISETRSPKLSPNMSLCILRHSRRATSATLTVQVLYGDRCT